MTMHQQFDMSFIASELAPHFITIQDLAAAGVVEAVNCEALSPRVQKMYLRAARARIVQLKAAADALLSQLGKVDELIEEQDLDEAA